MKNKRVIVSFVIIAVLLLYLIFSNTTGKNENIPDVKKLEKVDEMFITKDNTTLTLKKKDKDWYINDKYPADAVKVNKLETEMQNLEIINYISNKHYGRYDLSAEKAIHVVVKNEGKIQRDVLIGKASSTDRSAYIKIADDEGVYLAGSNLNSEFTKNVDELREKEIHTFGSDELTWFQLIYKGKTMTFEKKIEEATDKEKKEAKENTGKEEQKEKKTVENWYYKERGNVKIKKNKIDSLLSAFSTIRADKYPEIDKKNVKGLICMVKGKTPGKEITLNIHKKYEEEAYICSSSESPYIFTLEDWSAKRFFKAPKDFK